jgi:hypothetical protein
MLSFENKKKIYFPLILWDEYDELVSVRLVNVFTYLQARLVNVFTYLQAHLICFHMLQHWLQLFFMLLT